MFQNENRRLKRKLGIWESKESEPAEHETNTEATLLSYVSPACKKRATNSRFCV